MNGHSNHSSEIPTGCDRGLPQYWGDVVPLLYRWPRGCQRKTLHRSAWGTGLPVTIYFPARWEPRSLSGNSRPRSWHPDISNWISWIAGSNLHKYSSPHVFADTPFHHWIPGMQFAFRLPHRILQSHGSGSVARPGV